MNRSDTRTLVLQSQRTTWKAVEEQGKHVCLVDADKVFSREFSFNDACKYDNVLVRVSVNTYTIHEVVRVLRQLWVLLKPGGSLCVCFVDLVGVMDGSKPILPGYDWYTFNNGAGDQSQHWLERRMEQYPNVLSRDTMTALLLHTGFINVLALPYDPILTTSDNELPAHIEQLNRMHNTEITYMSADKPKGEPALKAAVISKNAPYAYEMLSTYGYEWDMYWCQNDSCDLGLKMEIDQEKAKKYMPRRVGKKYLTAFENSLRKNWVHMLTAAPEETRLFLEADAAPWVYASYLKEWCEDELKKHPDTDVLKLFSTLSHFPKSHAKDPVANSYTFLPGGTGEEVWGSHAYWVVNRGKLLETILDNAMPVDTAVEMAAKEGKLNVRVAFNDFFWQHPHVGTREVIN